MRWLGEWGVLPHSGCSCRPGMPYLSYGHHSSDFSGLLVVLVVKEAIPLAPAWSASTIYSRSALLHRPLERAATAHHSRPITHLIETVAVGSWITVVSPLHLFAHTTAPPSPLFGGYSASCGGRWAQTMQFACVALQFPSTLERLHMQCATSYTKPPPGVTNQRHLVF